MIKVKSMEFVGGMTGAFKTILSDKGLDKIIEMLKLKVEPGNAREELRTKLESTINETWENTEKDGIK